jgi:hypothetical protein
MKTSGVGKKWALRGTVGVQRGEKRSWSDILNGEIPQETDG